MNLKDVPDEVLSAWTVMKYQRYVGMDQWIKLNAIIRKYPEYFPWEAKYRSIPQEVHDAYYSDIQAAAEHIFSNSEDGIAIGIIPTLMNMDEQPIFKFKIVPDKPISEIFKDFFREKEEENKRAKKQQKKDKALWDKHYSKYGLNYKKQNNY